MAGFGGYQCAQRVGDLSHLSNLSSGLNQLRHEGAFCDFNIIVGEQQFPAHKAVLSSASDYFQAMLSPGFQESSKSEVTVPGTGESFAQILEFMYTGNFTLSVGTVVGILEMSCYMILAEAVKLCAGYLKSIQDELSIDDCLEIWSVTSIHNISEVAEVYQRYLFGNFLKCVNSSKFLENCSPSFMMEILEKEEIETDTITEEQILEGTLVWLKHDWEQRKVHAVDLLKKIRLGLVPVDKLHQILGDELLSIPECKDMVEEVVKISVTKDTATPPLNNSHANFFATRNTITAELRVVDDENSDHLISLCGSTETACYKLTKLADIPDQSPLLDLQQLRDGVAIHLVVTETGQLFAGCGVCIDYPSPTGNYKRWLSEKNFFKYDMEKNEWVVLPPMPILLCDHAMFVIDQYIYAVGGNTDSDLNSTIERYNVVHKTWEVVVNDNEFQPEYVGIVNGNILITGHYVSLKGNSADLQIFIACMYKPASNEWLQVSLSKSLDDGSYFFEHINKCYLVTRSENRINQCICDFDSGIPTIEIGQIVKDHTLNTIEQDVNFKGNRITNLQETIIQDHSLTFDKRKLGLVEIPCECLTHW